MPTEGVSDVEEWLYTAVVKMSTVFDPILLVASEKWYTRWQIDNAHPHEVVAPLLRVKDVVVFRNSWLVFGPKTRWFETWDLCDDMMFRRVDYLNNCEQNVGRYSL